MDAAHWHLILNHLPVLGTLFGATLLVYAMLFRKLEVLQAALGTLVAAGLAAIPVYLTGEGAEDIIEARAGVSEAAIEAHEEVALYALVAAIVLGAVALGGLLVWRKRVPGWFSGLVLVLALGTGGIMGYTANQGGQISHPEIRDDAAVSGGEEGEEEETEYDRDE